MAANDNLALDVYHLWYTAKSLREMGAAHSSAASTVQGSSAMYKLMRPASIGLGSTGFYDDWATLKEQIVGALTTNASSLDDTAQALDMCVESFTSTDEDIRTEFQGLKEDIPYE